jgi:DnaJ-class molecular chaperone
MASYYETLGVAKGASDADIKSAYRKKALEWHPDRNKTEGAADKFKEINRAYEVLSDKNKREIYDQVGHDSYTRSGGAGAPGAGYGYQQGPFSYSYSSNSNGANPFEGMNVDFDGANPFDIFEQFFGSQSPFGGGQRRKPRNLYQITLSFDEAIKGIERKFKIEGNDKTIKIPAGVDDGMRIRFNEFDIQVRVGRHPYFRRDGQDVYYEKQISFPQAVLGDTVEVPTLRKPVMLKIRPGTAHGTLVRLRSEGIPYPNSNRRGDMYVVYKIAVPSKLSGKAKKLMEELKKEM